MFKSSNRLLRVTASTICASFAVLLAVNTSVLFADCYRWVNIRCCTLSKLAITCSDDEFTWDCPPLIVEDNRVGVFFLVQEGGWSQAVPACGTDVCKYKKPFCGLLPGTCTWASQTSIRLCADCPTPDEDPDC